MAHLVVHSLQILLPQEVPSESSIAAWTHRHSCCATILQHKASDGVVTNYSMAEALEQILEQLPAAGEALTNMEGQPDDLAHDAYFHVQRVAHDEAGVFVRAILAARLVFLKEVADNGVTIGIDKLEWIDRGFADLLSCFFGGVVSSAAGVTEWQSAGETCAAMPRWVHGHQIFAALTQGLILSFRSIGQALRAGHAEEVRRWADLSVSLLNASAGAFVFTGDFPPAEYENVIRPSMMPPLSKICLSGLMSADHRYMAQTMRDMRPALKALGELEPERHERISLALAGVYDSHIYVCERFVGPQPSILTAGRTERSGPSLIEQFKTLRLKPFEQTRRAPRLTADKARGPLECPFHQ